MIKLTAMNEPISTTQSYSNTPHLVQNPLPIEPKKSFFPRKIILLLIILVLLPLLGTGTYLAVNKYFYSFSILSLVPANAEYYLSIAINASPQAKAMEKLTDRFPGGKKLRENPSFFSQELFGTPKDPFKDIMQLAKNEIFLAKLPDDKKVNDKTNSFSQSNPLEKLLNIVELDSSKQVAEKLNNFKTQTDKYLTTSKTTNGHEILNINLVSKSPPSTSYGIGDLPLNLTVPFSQAVSATGVDKYIISSEKESDINNALALFESNNLYSQIQRKKVKGILDTPEHQQLVTYTPKEAFLKFYQHQSLEAFSNLIPSSALTQSFLLGYDNLNHTQGDNAISLTRALSIVAEENGIRLNSTQVDWLTPKEDLLNPYKISNSLANSLPAKMSGLNPAVFAETKNLKQQYQSQLNLLKTVAQQTKNDDQKKIFQDAIASMDKNKVDFKTNFGLDLEKDLLDWMAGQASFIFNAGTTNKAPEFLFVFDIKDQKQVENSLKKIQLPNYKAEVQRRTGAAYDLLRQSNLREIGSAVSLYYTDNGAIPKNLESLKGKYIRFMPTDPVSTLPYQYTPSRDLKSATIIANLSDSRIAVYNTNTGTISIQGISKTTIDNSPLKPTPIPYRNTTIYSIVIFDGDPLLGTTSNFKYFLDFAVTNNKAIILLGDSARSLQDVIDFDSQSQSLASLNTWREQFEKVTGDVGGLVYIEPLRFYGIWEYYKNLIKQTSFSLDQSFSQNDWETVIKNYLATISSIGTTVTKNKPVYDTNTFVNIKEISQEERDKTEKALDRLLNPGNTNTNQQNRVQGISDTNWSAFFLNLRKKVLPYSN